MGTFKILIFGLWSFISHPYQYKEPLTSGPVFNTNVKEEVALLFYWNSLTASDLYILYPNHEEATFFLSF